MKSKLKLMMKMVGEEEKKTTSQPAVPFVFIPILIPIPRASSPSLPGINTKQPCPSVFHSALSCTTRPPIEYVPSTISGPVNVQVRIAPPDAARPTVLCPPSSRPNTTPVRPSC